MTKSEVGKIMMIISEGWRGFEVSETKINLWFDLLKDLDFKITLSAVKRLMSSGSPYPPAVSEIRKEVALISAPPELRQDLASAWTEVSRSIRFYGPCDEELALNSLSPLTRRVVEAIGWERICNEESEIVRGQFLRMYKEIRDNVLKELASPPELRLPEPPRPKVLKKPAKEDSVLEGDPEERLRKWQELKEKIAKLAIGKKIPDEEVRE